MKILKIYFSIFQNNFKYIIFFFKRKIFKKYFYDVSDKPFLINPLKEIIDEIYNQIKSYYFNNHNYDSMIKYRNIIKKIINKNISFNSVVLNKNHQEIISKLNSEGFAKFEDIKINQNKIEKIKKDIINFKVYPSHIPISAPSNLINFEEAKKKSNFASYQLTDLLTIKEFKEIIFSQEIKNIAYHFFGHLPVISNINLYWSFCNCSAQGPQMYHRDLDDFKVLNFFSNLTDTTVDNGSYKYIIGSHDRERIKEKIDYLDDNFFINSTSGYGLESLIRDEDIVCNEKEYYGNSGAIMVANGYCLHKAVKPKKNDRLVLWITFNSFFSCYEIRKIPFVKRINYNLVKEYFEDNLVNRYLYRNVIDF